MADSTPGGVVLDLAHLRRQTGGDEALEREVLTLFLTKSRADLARMAAATSARERREAAHALVGSARAVGAGEVARIAALIERAGELRPADIAALQGAVRDAESLIRRQLQG